MRSGQRGISIVEILVSLGLISIVAYGLLQAFFASYAVKYQVYLRATQETIAFDLESNLRSPNVIYQSVSSPLFASENAKFRNCLLGIGSGCTANLTDPNNPNLTLFSLILNNKRLSSANDETAVNYSTSGKRCKISEPDCLFTTETRFFAECDPLEGSTCSKGALKVHLMYKVRLIPGKYPTFGGKKIQTIKDFPDQPRFFTVRMIDVLGPGNQTDCPIGAKFVGIDSKGHAKCKCAIPYKLTDSEPKHDNLGKPICVEMDSSALVCPDGFSFRGMRNDGSANCIPIDDSYDCKVFPLNDNQTQMDQKCPAGSFIRNYRRSACSMYCYSGKAGASCDNLEGDRDLQGRDKNNKLSGLVCADQSVTCCRPKA